jgi:small subunit ribosomal protein S20
MANHKSALKRIRQDEVKRERNRYQHKTTRTMLKRIRGAETKKEAIDMLPLVYSHIDKCVKKNIFHKNKAANLKSKLGKMVNSMS